MSNDLKKRIAENVRRVQERIERAAEKCGRSAGSVQLVAVSKYAQIGDGIIDGFLAAGCFDLGEARPQSFFEKAQHYSHQPIRWHFIGSLQRNKIRKILPTVSLIHSVDSVRLAEAIQRIADETESSPLVHCLLEVAISQDKTKQGFAFNEVASALERLAAFPKIIVDGLMGMSSLDADESRQHREFASLRHLAETFRRNGCPANAPLTELSMGMSGDFEAAVEEGATIVRIGSILYP